MYEVDVEFSDINGGVASFQTFGEFSEIEEAFDFIKQLKRYSSASVLYIIAIRSTLVQ